MAQSKVDEGAVPQGFRKFQQRDPDKRQYRWYAIGIAEWSEPTLFDPILVEIWRGRAGQPGERIQRRFSTHHEAHTYIAAKTSQRLRHGYSEVSSFSPLADPDCAMCRLVSHAESDSCTIAVFEHTVFFVGWDQSYPARSLLVFKQHIPEFFHLSTSELLAALSEIRRAEAAIRAKFSPDMMNYLFMGNLARHVHLHLVPRYVGDPNFGSSPFLDSSRVKRPSLDSEEYRRIASRIRSGL